MTNLSAVKAAQRGWRVGGRVRGARIPGGCRSLAWAVVMTCLAVSSLAFGAPLAPTFIYGVADDGALWVMNLSAQTSGTLPPRYTGAGRPNGFAYDSTRNDLYVTDVNSNLYWWRQGEADFSLIATGSALGITGGSGLAFQPQNAAYYDNAYWFFRGSENPADIDLGSNILTKVSLDYSGSTPIVTGFASYTATQISGSNAFGDIAIRPDGTLYASAKTALYSLDLTTIGSGTVGGYTLISSSNALGLQIAIGSDNVTLYGQKYVDGTWYTIDTSDGTMTQVGTFTTLVNGGGTAGFPDLAGSAVQPVPEPSTLVLAALGGGMVAWQMVRRRRREKFRREGLGVSAVSRGSRRGSPAA